MPTTRAESRTRIIVDVLRESFGDAMAAHPTAYRHKFRRMAHDVTPGRSRVYAAVLAPGAVSVGDQVIVEP